MTGTDPRVTLSDFSTRIIYVLKDFKKTITTGEDVRIYFYESRKDNMASVLEGVLMLNYSVGRET